MKRSKKNNLEDTGWSCAHCGQFNTRTVVCVKCGNKFESDDDENSGLTKNKKKDTIQPPSLDEIARVLSLISHPHHIRDHSRRGDIQGDFDQWFDGGAVRIVTGFNEYKFNDGTTATIPVLPLLRVFIKFPNGTHISISQTERK